MIDNQKIISTIKQKINESHPGLIDDVILFGSRVSGTPTVDSDYDVLIITNKKINWRTKDAIIDICYDISLEYDILIDSKIISRFELNNRFWGKHPLYTDAINDGIHAK
ncbi:MAG: nucleotidyltransferase domain-containing protein [Bacteroidales bacterium]